MENFMSKKLTSLLALSIMSLSAVAQVTPVNTNIDIKALIDPGCFLNADDINFGVLAMPITNQSASSNMRVLCSKDTNLSIEMVYGASSGGGSVSGTFTAVEKSRNTNEKSYQIYKDGVKYTQAPTDSYDIKCETNDKVIVNNKEIADLYKVEYTAVKWVPDTGNICSGKYINTKTLADLGVPSQGKLTGITSGEQIVYSLEVPNSSTKVWNSTNKYPIVATGVEQSIPMKANIKSSENPTYRMSPDMYRSILTVVLTY